MTCGDAAALAHTCPHLCELSFGCVGARGPIFAALAQYAQLPALSALTLEDTYADGRGSRARLLPPTHFHTHPAGGHLQRRADAAEPFWEPHPLASSWLESWARGHKTLRHLHLCLNETEGPEGVRPYDTLGRFVNPRLRA